jgi:hypothetical protein
MIFLLILVVPTFFLHTFGLALRPSDSGQIVVGSLPVGIVFDTYNKYVYVTNFGSSTLSVINSSTNGSVSLTSD